MSNAPLALPRRRHSWVSIKKSRLDDDSAQCRLCGLWRHKEFMEPTVYKLWDDPRGRWWNYAPACPPDENDPGRARRAGGVSADLKAT
jgi:hypothetical protein